MTEDDFSKSEKKSIGRFWNKSEKDENDKDEKKDIDLAEYEKLTAQMEDMEQKLSVLFQQLTDIIIPEEESAEQVYEEKAMEFEKIRAELQKIDLDRNLAKVRWDDARNKIKTYNKQIKNYRNDINKIRKKINQPLLMDPDEENKSYKVFEGLKARTEREKEEKDPKEKETKKKSE